jgi:hypothetical protein
LIIKRRAMTSAPIIIFDHGPVADAAEIAAGAGRETSRC